MDDEIDIVKIETFLKKLKNEKPITSEFITNNSDIKNIKCNEPSSFNNSSIQRPGKCHNLSKSLNVNDKKKYLQVSLKNHEQCTSILFSLESSLNILLEECLKEQKVLRENIDAIDFKRNCDNKFARSTYSVCIRKVCSSPYFKDQQCFPCQLNEDFHLRKNAGYLDPWNIVRTVAWTDDQKRTLEKSIEDINIQEKTAACSAKNIPAVSSKMDEKSIALNNTNVPISFDKVEYDWIMISVMCLKNARSPLECRAMWFNYLHPKINKTRWTEKESTSLKMLAEKNNYEDWECVAHVLGTSRSAFQCIGHFKIRLDDFSKNQWFQRDFLLVQKLVKLFRISNFTPWGKIAWLMDGRSTGEIYRKWRSLYGGLKKGAFSFEEDLLLVAALKQYGEDWSLISQYLPNRDNVQVRGRVVVLKSRAVDGGPWSPFEDKMLEELVQKYGFGNWAKISSHFLYRTNVQLRARYKSIKKFKEKQLDNKTPVDAIPPLALDSKSLKDGLSLNEIWETAQKIVQDKLKIDPKDTSSGINVIKELSRILKPKSKRGRKKGTINFPLLQKEYYSFFHVAHSQRGGRGKDICTEVPTLVFNIVLMLHLLYAKIILPCEKYMIEKDCSILDMDKSVIRYLLFRKESVLDNCKFIIFEDISECSGSSRSLSSAEHSSIPSGEIQCEEWYPLCPPSGSVLIGLRTMLLNRTNVREQSKDFTGQKVNTNTSQTLSNSDNYLSASALWNKRIEMMYAWTAFLSKVYPNKKIVTDSTPQINDLSLDEMKRKTPKRRARKRPFHKSSKKSKKDVDTNVKVENSEVTSHVKQKRVYVKSGKFAAKTKVSGSTRRNTRNTKIDFENMCID